MENGNQGFSNFSKAEQRLPKEEMLEVIQNRKNIVIGIPKEITCQENRVPLTPEAVSLLCGSGHRVMIEAGAGEASHYSDHDFSEAGADVVYSPQEVYKAGIVLKVSPPTGKEIDMFHPGGALISALNVNGRDNEYFRKITAKKLTALAYELIRDDAGLFPVVRSMSEIVGRNGERGCQRYIISNSQSRLHIMQVYHMIRWTHGAVDFDVTPLFETVADLANGADIMNSLYNDETYSKHLMKRNNTQFIMLGFSDGTKDGGYMQANWSIYKAKETITRVSRENGIKVIFFDGRGGPPARGGGKSNKFYSSLGPTIEDKEVQLTIQGQTISSNFGTTISARYNLEQLLSAGLENSLFSDEHKALDSSSREILDEIARISFECYSDFKFDEDFLPYLEQMGTLPYYAMTNIASRPVKRKGSGKTELKSLRAIPFVGSWNQMKQNVPGFYGLGTALRVFEERGDLYKIKTLYTRSQFFRTLMENCMMSLSKCYFPLTQYLSGHPEFGRIWNKIHDEYLLTKHLVLEISGQSSLMELAPNARDSVKLREHLVLPILVIQQYALQKIRELEAVGEDDKAQTYHTMVMRTMFAIINAGRNSA